MATKGNKNKEQKPIEQTLWDAANKLRGKVAKEWSELNGVEITPEMINCVGCRLTGVKTPFCQSLCQIRQCALGRKVITCGDCNEMTACFKLSDIISNNPDARRRLEGK